MKTIVVATLLLLLSHFPLWAQTERGRWLLGTSLSNLTYQKQASGYRNIALGLTPSAGYFVANGLVVGTGIPLSFSGIKYGDAYPNYYNLRLNGESIGLSPFVRYYFGPAKWKPFLGVAYGYSSLLNKFKADNGGGTETKSTGHSTALTPTIGLAYFFTRTLGLALSVNYTASHLEYSTVAQSPLTPALASANTNTRSLSVGIGLQIFVGR